MQKGILMFHSETIPGAQALNILKSVIVGTHIPATLTVQYQNGWQALKGSMKIADDRMLLEFPPPQPMKPTDLLGQKCTLLFKLGSYRYVAEIAALAGISAESLAADMPKALVRYERRAHRRIDVPEKYSVRAEILIGGPQTPRWSGKVTNLSEGGFQVRTSSSISQMLEPGDAVSVAIRFGTEHEPIRLKAHFRAVSMDGSMAFAGFQFTHTNSPKEFAQILDMILMHLTVFEKE